MTLVLHEHPFAAYCWKALIALYERHVPFERVIVDGDEARARHAELWPLQGMPVLVDGERVLPESTVVVEYLDRFGDAPPLIPADADAALQTRLWDRVLDGHVMTPMQTIVFNALRPDDHKDPYGVDAARASLDRAYEVLDAHLTGGWMAGREFTLADCTAAPALHYARVLHRWEEQRLTNLTRYFVTLMLRSSVSRVIEEARPYRHLFPLPWPDYAE
jgi:glutathione S-transferase